MEIRGNLGRPVREADLDLEHDPNQEIYTQFYEACRTLDWADISSLARGLRVTVGAIRHWKTGRRFPMDIGTPLLVIRWVNRGKPVKMRTQAEIATSMLSRN